MGAKLRMLPKPEYNRNGVVLYRGDCLKLLPLLKKDSVDTVITDPPYELTSVSRKGSTRKRGNGPAGRHRIGEASGGFMGKAWDATGISFDPETWRAVLRVAKPGAFMLCFGGTRTYHRIACAIEDAGWIIRDCMMWLQGQGFPKGHKISTGIDKLKGVKRKKKKGGKGAGYQRRIGNTRPWMDDPDHEVDVDEPVTPEAKLWYGWNVALKPSWEPIIVAMKPLDGTFAQNALKHGVAGLNIDGARIGYEADDRLLKGGTYGGNRKSGAGSSMFGTGGKRAEFGPLPPKGRWPANVILSHSSECVCVGTRSAKGFVINTFDDGAKPFGGAKGKKYSSWKVKGGEADVYACVPGCPVRMLDEQSSSTGGGFGGASRFFYAAKVSTSERDAGLASSAGERNLHPTVKPLDLMIYLCRLTATPTGGVVLDPFAGSGTTLLAAKVVSRDAVGIELEDESCRTAAKRLSRRTRKGVGVRKKLKKPKRGKRERAPGRKQNCYGKFADEKIDDGWGRAMKARTFNKNTDRKGK